ncbi:MAG: C10 family peptidase [bacterium]
MLDPSLPKIPIAYLVHLEMAGFILVSVKRDLTPIKAYSLACNFGDLPEGYRNFLFQELEYQTRAIMESEKRLKGIYLNTENQRRWAFLLNYDGTKIRYLYTPGTNLLNTLWHQKDPYNRFLPEIGDKRTLAGCVSVALAQIMKYHNYPISGKGVVSYDWDGQIIRAVLYKNYHWDNMPQSLDLLTPEYEVDEVAGLIRDLAFANETDFGLDESLATVNIAALIENFGYAKAIESMDKTDENLFFQTIRDEIDANRPVLLRFPGHMAVADGYSSNASGREIHVNFGWGGRDNGYYFLDQNVITTNHVYPPDNLKIYYNIKPCIGSDCYPNLETGDYIQDPNIFGRFNYSRDTDEYDVYLKGMTTISGTRYYPSIQAFFISIYDSGYHFLASDDNAIIMDLPADRYTIKASLWANNSYYSEDGHLDYKIQITTDAMTPEEITTIDDNLDVPPYIANEFKDLILNSEDEPHKIRIDTSDENGDAVTLGASSSHSQVNVTIDDNEILTITPDFGISGIAGKIDVTATANSRTTEKSFIAFILDENVFFGKEFEIADQFIDQNTFNKHKVILDGPCTITGYNGFSDQEFFTCVMDSMENFVVDPNNRDINSPFDQGFYLIGASLWSEPKTSTGYFYPYQAGNGDIYRITVKCPDADDDIYTVANMLGIDISDILPQGVGEGFRYASIQDAIDHAVDGDIITVHDGTYFENISFDGKSITIRSENGPYATIIDGNDVGSVVSFDHNEDANSILNGFTIRNGNAEKGGGILCQNASPRIVNCFIKDNHANSEGGGIYADNTSLKLINCLFSGNQANGLPDHISLKPDLITYRDLQIMDHVEGPDILMQIYHKEEGLWTSRYRFFKKLCGRNASINNDDVFLISRFTD